MLDLSGSDEEPLGIGHYFVLKLLICQVAVKISKNVISERAFGIHFYLGPILYLLVSFLITIVLQAAQVSKRCGEAWKVAQKALGGNILFSLMHMQCSFL